jgi:capsular exopolysaccharide synthesis family protein
MRVFNVNKAVISTIFRAALKWWWLVIVMMVVCVAVSFLVRRDQPDIFVSTATVIVGQDPFQGSGASTGFIGVNNLLEAYAALTRRSTILQPVIDDLQLGINTYDLNGMMSIATNPTASLMEITINDIQADRAALIANRIADELIRQSGSSNRASSSNDAFVQSELNSLQQQIDQLQARYAELLSEGEQLTSAFEISQNLAEREAIQSTIMELRGLYAQLGATTTDGRSLVRIFEPAIPNYFAISQNNNLELIFAAAAGAVLAIVTIVLITFFDDRLQWDDNENELIHGQKILGPLGVVPQSKLPLYVDTAPDSIESEALRQARSKVILAAEGGQPKIITFTSYDSGDGKTVTTANMALLFAQTGLRTLVVDGDMRKGNLHELFRLPNMFGFSDVLAQRDAIDRSLRDAIIDSGYDNLSIITRGRSNLDTAALLTTPRMLQTINQLERQFDILLFDSVPTLGGPDAVFLAEASDGVVIVVNTRRTTNRGLKRTIANLEGGKAVTILGVAFNRVRLQVTSKYNNTYYYRATQVMSSEVFNRQLIKPGTNPWDPRIKILVDGEGERYYSLSACATYLDVSKATIKEWCKSGYLDSKRMGFRLWVKEREMEQLVMRSPSHAPAHPPEPALSMTDESEAHFTVPPKNVTARLMPQQLREQRDALLDYVNNPDNPLDDDV